jgi:limonene-1,2-epoxide hydrolase
MAESANMKMVRALFASWNARDIEGMLSHFAEDGVWHNIPLGPAQGIAAIRAIMEPFLALATEVNFRIEAAAESDSGTIFTERLDRFKVKGTWIELPVVGVFEFAGGRIAVWRDYYCKQQLNAKLAEIGIGAPSGSHVPLGA